MRGDTYISLGLDFVPSHKFAQLQVVATNSGLTELRDMKLVKAGAIESQDTPTNVQKRIEGVSTLVGENF